MWVSRPASTARWTWSGWASLDASGGCRAGRPPGGAGCRGRATREPAGSAGTRRGTSVGTGCRRARAVARAGSPTARRCRAGRTRRLANRRCSSAARSGCSLGRSRTSWIDSADAITSTSRTHPNRSASITIRPSRGSIGRRASRRPILVSERGSRSRRRRHRARRAAGHRRGSPRESGGSTNGKRATSPSPIAVICKMTDARLVRRISGSVNSGRGRRSRPRV